MAKKCPTCGKFMTLQTFEDVGKDPWDSFMWWGCSNFYCDNFETNPIPAPEYQWEWNCEGIPFDVLRDWPELLKEYTELWDRLPNKLKRAYRQYDPAKIGA